MASDFLPAIILQADLADREAHPISDILDITADTATLQEADLTISTDTVFWHTFAKLWSPAFVKPNRPDYKMGPFTVTGNKGESSVSIVYRDKDVVVKKTIKGRAMAYFAVAHIQIAGMTLMAIKDQSERLMRKINEVGSDEYAKRCMAIQQATVSIIKKRAREKIRASIAAAEAEAEAEVAIKAEAEAAIKAEAEAEAEAEVAIKVPNSTRETSKLQIRRRRRGQ